MNTLAEAPAALSVDVLASAAELEAIGGEWRSLWMRSPRATPFQSPDWLLPWWRRLGGGELRALAVRADDRLAGLFPLFVWTGGGVRQLTPLGNGISDQVDVLAAAGAERAVAAAIVAHLAARDDWDTADFRDLPDHSPLLAARLPDAIAATVEDGEPSPVLPVPPGAAVESIVPRALAKKLAYYRRRLEREFAVELQSADDDASAGELFDALVRLHGARWAERGEPGVLGHPATIAFHREVIAAFRASGILRLYGLRLNGEIAAVWYGFAAKRRTYYYLGGFDPGLDRYSPGTVIIGHALERAAAEGARELGFLRGREAYKYAWGAADRSQHRLRLRRCLPGGVA